MSRRGLRYVTIGLIILVIGFALSLYLTIPRYSAIFKSEVYAVNLKNNEVAYLFELIDYSVKHGSVWGNVTITSSTNTTLHISLIYPNGTKAIVTDTLMPSLTKRIYLTGCIIEEARVIAENGGMLKYDFELFYREDAPLSVLMMTIALIIIGLALGLKGLASIFLEAEGVRD